MLFQKKKLINKTFLVTAGPTHEKIDPVRFIGNYSSGKMGYAIAVELAQRGGKVLLVSGPVNIQISHPLIERFDVTSALEMYEKCVSLFPKSNCAIMCAAVADYAPVVMAEEKLKRKKGNLKIELKPNPDIAATLGKMKQKGQILVGFALETNNEIHNATYKLKKKNLDFIVLNSLNDKGAGFQTDTNKISILQTNNKITNFELKPKRAVASDIADFIEGLSAL